MIFMNNKHFQKQVKKQGERMFALQRKEQEQKKAKKKIKKFCNTY